MSSEQDLFQKEVEAVKKWWKVSRRDVVSFYYPSSLWGKLLAVDYAYVCPWHRPDSDP